MAPRTFRECGASAVLVLSVLHSAAFAQEEKWEDPAWGVCTADIPKDLKLEGVKDIQWPTKKGALVLYVMKNSPADKAGLDTMDIIYAAAGKKIVSAEDVGAAISAAGFDKSSVLFYHPLESNGRIVFRRRSGNVVPVKYRQMIEDQVERVVNEATGSIHYRHVDTTPVVNKESSVELMLTGSDKPQLSMRITYVAKEWLFIRGYSFVIDGDRYRIDTAEGEVERDHDTRIWEWYVGTADATDKDSQIMKISRALANGVDSKLFFLGDQYQQERTISSEEKARIAVMLAFLDSRPK